MSSRWKHSCCMREFDRSCRPLHSSECPGVEPLHNHATLCFDETFVSTELQNWIDARFKALKTGVSLKCHTFVNWIPEQDKLIMTFRKKHPKSWSSYSSWSFANKLSCRLWNAMSSRNFFEKLLHSQKVTVWCAVSVSWFNFPYLCENVDC